MILDIARVFNEVGWDHRNDRRRIAAISHLLPIRSLIVEKSNQGRKYVRAQ